MRKIPVFLGALLLLILGGCSSNENDSASTSKKDKDITIYMVRHGETFFNMTDQVQGFCDSQLTKNGQEQAKKLGKGLEKVNFDSAYSSDLGRQRNTAKLILAENLNDAPDLVELDGFKEWNYGGFEGKSNAEMWEPIFKENGLELDEEWSNYEKLVASLGDKGIADAIARLDQLNVAESYDEIVERGEKAMNQVVSDAKKNNNENILIVSSGSMIPTLLTTMTPEDYNGEKIGNCSVTKVIYSGDKYSVESIGDTSYLE